jgi:hypothetical protein
MPRTPSLGPADRRLYVNFRADEHDMLLAMVKTSGLSVTDVLRTLVRRAYAGEEKCFIPVPTGGVNERPDVLVKARRR